jgi:hypothetical protein
MIWRRCLARATPRLFKNSLNHYRGLQAQSFAALDPACVR